MSRFSIFRWGKKSESDKESRASDGDRFVADNVDRKKKSNQKNEEDSHLPEKKRARRRLVGSVTLVLAAIIVLPMIFESEPKPVSPNLLIDIPSRDKNVPTVEQPVASAATTETAVTPPEQGTVQLPAEQSAAVTQDTPAQVSGVAPVTENTAVFHEKPAVEKVEKPAKAEKLVKEDKHETAPKAKKEADADPIGKMIAASDKNGKQVKSEKHLIQVAALTSPQKVSELQARLSKVGIHSHTQKMKSKNGEERIRVRIGPLSKSETDSTCAKLGKLGLSCTVLPN